MRRLMMLFPVILLLAACGGKNASTKVPPNASTSGTTQQSDSSSTTSSSSSSETSPVIADLFSLLVTDQDLPGWQFLPTRPSMSGPNDPCNSDMAPGIVIADPMQDQSATYLTKGGDGPFVVEQIDRYATTATTSGVLSKVADALKCKSWTDTDSAGNQVDWKLESLNVGKIGQNSVAVLTSQSDGSVNIGVVYMQEGSYLVSIAYLSSDKPAASTVSDVAKKADEKVKQALSSAAAP